MNLDDVKNLWSASIEAAQIGLSVEDQVYRDIGVVVHNASWCPDCEREVSYLLAVDAQAQEGFGDIALHSYEDKESYRLGKQSGTLPINCLPTIIFSLGDKEFYRIEEDSAGELMSILKKEIDSNI